VIRWAAMLYANGYDVLAADRRDFSAEDMAGYGYPTSQQALGWKESEDVLAAGRYLAAKRGVLDVGLVGFSEGGQNTVLALALDRGHVFAARVPLLSFYAADDSLVPSFEAGMMAGYEVGNPLQATYEVTRGEQPTSSTAGGSSGRSSSTSRRSFPRRAAIPASRRRRPQGFPPGPALLLCQGGARFECVEDDADELSFEAADGFAAAFAFGAFAFEVGAGTGVVARLGDRDSVEGSVELSVAAAVEPVSLTAA